MEYDQLPAIMLTLGVISLLLVCMVVIFGSFGTNTGAYTTASEENLTFTNSGTGASAQSQHTYCSEVTSIVPFEGWT